MKRAIVDSILDVQEKLRCDQALMEEYESAQEAFQSLLAQLTEAQQDVLLDYLGVGIELHLRMLELCFEE